MRNNILARCLACAVMLALGAHPAAAAAVTARAEWVSCTSFRVVMQIWDFGGRSPVLVRLRMSGTTDVVHETVAQFDKGFFVTPPMTVALGNYEVQVLEAATKNVIGRDAINSRALSPRIFRTRKPIQFRSGGNESTDSLPSLAIRLKLQPSRHSRLHILISDAGDGRLLAQYLGPAVTTWTSPPVRAGDVAVVAAEYLPNRECRWVTISGDLLPASEAR